MPIYRLDYALEASTLIPRDRIQNTWWLFGAENLNNAQWETNVAYFTNFYNSWSNIRSPELWANRGIVKVYDTDLPSPAEPVYEAMTSISRSATTALPLDCAAVVTFAAAPTPGVRLQSLRNRVYLGGLSAAVNGPDGRITSTFRNTIATAYNTLKGNLDTAGDVEHMVYSKKMAIARAVDRAWMNDQWDTQRRRDRPTNVRTEFW